MYIRSAGRWDRALPGVLNAISRRIYTLCVHASPTTWAISTPDLYDRTFRLGSGSRRGRGRAAHSLPSRDPECQAEVGALVPVDPAPTSISVSLRVGRDIRVRTEVDSEHLAADQNLMLGQCFGELGIGG
jgi:hypothetical protein